MKYLHNRQKNIYPIDQETLKQWTRKHLHNRQGNIYPIDQEAFTK